MLRSLLFSAGLLLSASVLQAQDAELRSTTPKPISGAPTPASSVAPEAPSLEDEAKRDLRASDAKLREVYDKLILQLNVGERQALQTVQNQWIAYRDATAQTTAALSSPSETHQALLTLLELRKLTEERTQALHRISRARTK